jgi:hypothetical protein
MKPPHSVLAGLRVFFASGLRKLASSNYGIVLIGLGVLLLVGMATLVDYGASMDEGPNLRMGRTFLGLYETGSLLRSPQIDYFNGPFYFMVFTITSMLFRALNPNWLWQDGLHLTNYITFLVGGLIFYRIALRLLPRGAALLMTALFATQPVLFGHGFINQKDTPLMVFFMASVELGWTAVEARLRVEGTPPNGADGPRRVGIAAEWKRLHLGTRVALATGVTAALLMLLDLWWFGGVHAASGRLLTEAYAGRGPMMIVELFGRIAEDSHKTPLSAYLAKLDSFFVWGRLVVSLAAVGGALGAWRLTLPESFSDVLGRWTRRWGMVVLAGVVLGMATSIRLLAPFAGLLVVAYWIGRSGRRALPGIVVYGVVAALTTYLTWPALWGNPIVALLHRATSLSEFANHFVHLWGARFDSADLPWNYLPTMLAVQLTLPAIALFLIGIPYSWLLSGGDRDRRLLVSLVLLWQLVPVGIVVLGRVPIYHSFRHVLFALPPAFLVMGYGAWKLIDLFRAPVLRAGLAVAVLVPGVVGIVQLHPYEYIYFNQLVGGVHGAEGRFDMDYWCTSFREAVSVLNQVASAGDEVALVPTFTTATGFIREDLRPIPEEDRVPEPDFALACRRFIGEPSLYPDMETIYEVRVDGALLAVLKRRRGEE